VEPEINPRVNPECDVTQSSCGHAESMFTQLSDLARASILYGVVLILAIGSTSLPLDVETVTKGAMSLPVGVVLLMLLVGGLLHGYRRRRAPLAVTPSRAAT
jgi:hypothetical protein